MAKRKTAPGPGFDAATLARLQAIGKYESASEGGTCEINFDAPLDPVDGLPEFDVMWFIHGPGRTPPPPADGLFELWQRYQSCHASLCREYQQLLFNLFEKSHQSRYDDRQWKLQGRTRPTPQNLRTAVSSAEVRLEQYQAKATSQVFEIRVAFVVFWDEHGVAFPLHESGSGFTLGKWSGIGDV